MINIILLDHSFKLRNRLRKIFNDRHVRIEVESDFKALLNDFHSTEFDVAIINSQHFKDQPEAFKNNLKKINSNSPQTQVLVLAEGSDISLAVQSLRSGIYHYLKLPVSDNELRLLIETALKEKPRFLDYEAPPQDKRTRFGDIIGGSTIMQRIYDQIEQAAMTDIPVLILGETGTGKDIVSQAIHRVSPRADGPYLPLNLGALPPQLVASELFGHEKGSFTGAVERHKGIFEQANEGTVFLDEIDSINEKVQVSLLRLIEQNKFRRLGGKQSIKSRGRLIAASNEDLEERVEQGSFRIDLFYRLDVFRITMPPLRERQSDIPLLVEDMLAKYNRSYKRAISGMDQESLDALISYSWPGNVRELKNVIQRAVLVCEKDKIRLQNLPPRFQEKTEHLPSISFSVGTSLNEVEREMIRQTLAASNNNRKKAAELLGISRRALYNKLQKHSI